MAGAHRAARGRLQPAPLGGPGTWTHLALHSTDFRGGVRPGGGGDRGVCIFFISALACAGASFPSPFTSSANIQSPVQEKWQDGQIPYLTTLTDQLWEDYPELGAAVWGSHQ